MQSCNFDMSCTSVGPLPWDDMSSSEDEFSPRPRQKQSATTAATADDNLQENGASPRATANGPAKAPPHGSPAQGKAGATKGMSFANQIAFGAKGAQERFQVCVTPQ